MDIKEFTQKHNLSAATVNKICKQLFGGTVNDLSEEQQQQILKAIESSSLSKPENKILNPAKGKINPTHHQPDSKLNFDMQQRIRALIESGKTQAEIDLEAYSLGYESHLSNYLSNHHNEVINQNIGRSITNKKIAGELNHARQNQKQVELDPVLVAWLDGQETQETLQLENSIDLSGEEWNWLHNM